MKKVLIILALLFQIGCEKVETIENSSSYIFSWTKDENGWDSEFLAVINGNPGDLYVELNLEPHPWFERDGQDLLMALPLSYADLSLGIEIEIPHIDSKNLKI